MLMHAGKAGDVVNYCLVMGGHRYVGVVKDPSYHYAHGGLPMEGWHMGVHDNPQFSYITETLPDKVIVPYIDIDGCPVPITDLNRHACRPAYFILKLPKTALPIGDTVIEVQINGQRRDYVVSRPDFALHRRGRDMGRMYDKLMDLPDGAFDLQTDNGRDSSLDVHVKDKRIPGMDYLVFMKSKDTVIDLNNVFSWTEEGWITIQVQKGLPVGRYKLAVMYATNDADEWRIVTQGNVVIKDRNPEQLNIELDKDTAKDVVIDLTLYNIQDVTKYNPKFKAYIYDMSNGGEGTELTVIRNENNISVQFPAMQEANDLEWECFYSIMSDSEHEGNDAWVPMVEGSVTIKEQL